ncbi:MAG: asparagine synthase (glutamine-hydrolyzing) [Chitinivibrionales bacterium]|nr:asparagine synthase (glutamine-hydrolyzing) [Chitinivibrionales bacterium]
MCGIAGIVHTANKGIDRTVLQNMTDALAHRGPDDSGIYLSDTSRGSSLSIGLGHRRLSIIDLSNHGRQPMSNENQTIWITFNGEIYNFQSLRSALIQKGHHFRSETDTEVIIHGYEEYKEALFNKLNGMFSFGLWDENVQKLYLVRDRYGQKPLYYRQTEKGIIFASELKALLKHPDLHPEIDLQSLGQYLSYEYVPAPHCIIKGVQKLLPGHFCAFSRGKTSVHPYWHIEFDRRETIDEREAEHQFIELLKQSIERRLMSDVPLGVFLSGGIDSSSIVALLSEIMDPKSIKTFSIGFKEKSFNESHYARKIAGHFGTNHHERIFTPGEMFDILPEIWKFLDEPFADASVLPTYLLSRITREHVTVALGGDGGDELLAGYDPFLAHAFARHYNRIPSSIHKNIIVPLADKLPASNKNMSLSFILKKFIGGVQNDLPRRNQIWLGAFSATEQQSLLSKDVQHALCDFDPYGDIASTCSGTHFRDWIDELVFIYSRFYLAEDILTKIDRASMAVSLEVRSPFLDVEFAEYVNRLPSNLKMKGLTRKYLLKKSVEKKLPKEIIHRKKKGFGIPLTKWIKEDFRPILADVFAPEKIKSEGFFEPQAIQHLLSNHFDEKQDNRKQIWTLLMFEMWKNNYLS